jgi:hypothetical protein
VYSDREAAIQAIEPDDALLLGLPIAYTEAYVHNAALEQVPVAPATGSRRRTRRSSSSDRPTLAESLVLGLERLLVQMLSDSRTCPAGIRTIAA